jgi:hypothetical protein
VDTSHVRIRRKGIPPECCGNETANDEILRRLRTHWLLR